MRNKLRRYELLLPARDNNGQEFPEELLGEAVMEIVKQFSAVSYYKNAAEGFWQHGETLFRDDLGLIVIDVPDTLANRKWMKAYKSRWKLRLEQLEIWLVSYLIDVE